MQQFFSFSIRNSSWVLIMEPFPADAKTSLAFLSEFFLGLLFQQFPAYATILLDFLSEICFEACLCNNFQFYNNFLAFLS